MYDGMLELSTLSFDYAKDWKNWDKSQGFHP